MIISELNYLESAANVDVFGASGSGTVLKFTSINAFQTIVKPPKNVHNISAAAGADAAAVVLHGKAFSYTKTDTSTYVDTSGNSLSASTSVSLLSPRHYR